jgi:hypothetical protein
MGGSQAKGEERMTDWMTEEDGIPHKNGKVRWYVVGADEDVYGYLGWYDMTDWNSGWDKLFADVMRMGEDMGVEPIHAIRGDCIDEIINDLKVMKQHMKKLPKLPYEVSND